MLDRSLAIGQTISFTVGVHTNTGVIADIRGGGFASNENSILLVQVSDDPVIYEIVYRDEVNL